MNRRLFLKTAGASVLISGLAGSSMWLSSRTPTKAYEPWSPNHSGYGDPRLDALAYAILAPNPHNRQPWQVKLVNTDQVELYCDLHRRLPHTDPYDRQILIGLGCFSELFIMAANHKGYQVSTEVFPEGAPTTRLDQRVIARFSLKHAKTSSDPLFEQALQRRSSKIAFDTQKSISPSHLDALVRSNLNQGSITSINNQASMMEVLQQASIDAMTVEMTTPRTLQESVDLMRIGKAEVEKNPDGIDLTGAPMEILNNLGIVTRAAMSDTSGTANKQFLSEVDQKFRATTGYVWITTPGNSRAQQFQAGRDYVRLNLQANQLGLGIQPLSQALQEFSEMDALYDRVHRILSVEQPSRIQMLARIGYCNAVGPSPRWPLSSRIIKA